MSVATEQTKKHFVDLRVQEIVLWTKRIVIEAPASLDASELAKLNGEELDCLTENHGREVDWQIEKTGDWTPVGKIDVLGPVPDDVKPNLVFKLNKVGDLIEAESGKPAAFDF